MRESSACCVRPEFGHFLFFWRFPAIDATLARSWRTCCLLVVLPRGLVVSRSQPSVNSSCVCSRRGGRWRRLAARSVPAGSRATAGRTATTSIAAASLSASCRPWIRLLSERSRRGSCPLMNAWRSPIGYGQVNRFERSRQRWAALLQLSAGRSVAMDAVMVSTVRSRHSVSRHGSVAVHANCGRTRTGSCTISWRHCSSNAGVRSRSHASCARSTQMIRACGCARSRSIARSTSRIDIDAAADRACATTLAVADRA